VVSVRTFRIIAFYSCLATLAGCGREKVASAGNSASPAAQIDFSDFKPSPPAPLPANLSRNIAAGTSIPVLFDYVLDSTVALRTQFMYSTTAADVKGTDGGVAIPAHSTVTIIVRDSSRRGSISRVEIGLYTVSIGGRTISLSDGAADAANLVFTEDAGLGPGHSSVHVERGTLLEFKLSRPVELR
jgi:hypothetical protein